MIIEEGGEKEGNIEKKRNKKKKKELGRKKGKSSV